MAIAGRCVIEIAEDTRTRLKEKGAIPRGISYDHIINGMIVENEKVIQKIEKVEKQNDNLQDAVIKIASNLNGGSNGD